MKKQFHLTIISIIILALTLSACNIQIGPFSTVRGSGIVTSEERQVSAIEKVVFNGLGDLIITQGTEEKLSIEAEENILPKITSEMKGNTLELGYEARNWQTQIIPTKKIVFRLTVIDLSALTINGAVTLTSDGLSTSSFDLSINGTGELDFSEFNATELKVVISGGAAVTFSGNVQKQTVVINGAGNYDAGELQSSVTDIKFNGAGDSTVWATEKLDISITGAGGVRYYGDPHVSQNIQGLGNVSSLGEK
ncbi:MAG: DUF2807 domain-containing protein [Anaerolineaceae bacterium]|nr:DUF2807 domain-containing protein [Anaerolineaceae bacterium]